MLGVRVPLRPCLPALHYRHLHGSLTLYAELIRFQIYGRYRRQAFDLQVSLLEVLRAQTELQTERDGLQTLPVHVRDVGPLQELRVDLIEAEKWQCIFSRPGRQRRDDGGDGDNDNVNILFTYVYVYSQTRRRPSSFSYA